MIQTQARSIRMKPSLRWEAVKWEDWPSDGDLAKVMGVSTPAVRYWRVKLAPDSSKTARHLAYMASLDWSKGNWQLSEETGMTLEYLAQWRYNHGYPRSDVKNRRPHPGSEKWLGVDWTMRDIEITTVMPVTRQAVGIARRKYAPETVIRTTNENKRTE